MKTIKIFLTFFTVILLMGCQAKNNINNDINVVVNKKNIEFEFPKDKEVFVNYYEVNDYESFEKDGRTFKRLYTVSDIHKEMKKIVISDYKAKKLIDNNAYYLLIAAHGLSKNTSRFTSIGFCLYKEKVLIKLKGENAASFIKRCHAFS